MVSTDWIVSTHLRTGFSMTQLKKKIMKARDAGESILNIHRNYPNNSNSLGINLCTKSNTLSLHYSLLLMYFFFFFTIREAINLI